MKILIINTTKRKYGGKVYEKMVIEALSRNFEIKIKNVSFRKSEFLSELYNLSKERNVNLVIRNFDSSLFLSKKPVKNVAIVHHIDSSCKPLLQKIVYSLFEKVILFNLKRFDAIVTVSKYWRDYFIERNYKNVYLIYNTFNLNEFNFSSKEIEEFKKRYNLTKKPIVYLGNCQKAKGVVEAYKALEDLDVYLITSGKPMVKIPAINLNLSRRNYLKLLKASSIVITMSKFKEGWCRSAHESMLLKTPVIGSGLGGMRELLEGGKQIICQDFQLLREKVQYLLNHPEIRKKRGEDGYNFAKNFTLERFEKDWLKLIKRLI